MAGLLAAFLCVFVLVPSAHASETPSPLHSHPGVAISQHWHVLPRADGPDLVVATADEAPLPVGQIAGSAQIETDSVHTGDSTRTRGPPTNG